MLLNSCAGSANLVRTRLLDMAAPGGRLALDAVLRYNGGASYERFPVLLWNGREVANALTDDYPVLPLQARHRARLEVHELPDKDLFDNGHRCEVDGGRRYGWNIFVDPARFSRAEFDGIMRAYEHHASLVDSALALSHDPGQNRQPLYFPVDRIVRFVYGAGPQEPVFFDDPAHPVFMVSVNLCLMWDIRRVSAPRTSGWYDGRAPLRADGRQYLAVRDFELYQRPSFQTARDQELNHGRGIHSRADLLAYLATFRNRAGEPIMAYYEIRPDTLFTSTGY